MSKFIWKAELKIKPSLQKSEVIGGYTFKVIESGETIAKQEYITNSYNELHPKRIHDYEYAEQTLARLDIDTIREIMLKRMIYQRAFSPINIELVDYPTLVNREDLIKSGVELKRSAFTSHTIRYCSLDVNDSIEESELFWKSGFHGITKHQENEIIRIADWLEKSESENDQIKSFILAWIGFNGLYNLFASLNKYTGNDTQKFEFMIDKLNFQLIKIQEVIKSITKEMSEFKTYSIKSESGKMCWSNKLEEEIKKPTIDNLAIMKLILRCIYAVRKQVFHEAPRTNDILERVIVSKAALIPISALCLKTLVNS